MEGSATSFGGRGKEEEESFLFIRITMKRCFFLLMKLIADPNAHPRQ